MTEMRFQAVLTLFSSAGSNSPPPDVSPDNGCQRSPDCGQLQQLMARASLNQGTEVGGVQQSVVPADTAIASASPLLPAVTSAETAGAPASSAADGAQKSGAPSCAAAAADRICIREWMQVARAMCFLNCLLLLKHFCRSPPVSLPNSAFNS
jgi:hypothetical protein